MLQDSKALDISAVVKFFEDSMLPMLPFFCLALSSSCSRGLVGFGSAGPSAEAGAS